MLPDLNSAASLPRFLMPCKYTLTHLCAKAASAPHPQPKQIRLFKRSNKCSISISMPGTLEQEVSNSKLTVRSEKNIISVLVC
eukprot:1783767-Amphidinium_carterae.1